MDFIRFALQYAYSRRNAAAYIAVCCVAYLIVFVTRKLSLTLLGYLILFSLAPVVFFEILRMLRVYQKHLTMGDISEVNAAALDEFAAKYPPDESLTDGDYQALLRRCVAASEEAETAPTGIGFAEYYTRWGKEIKEPVNAMEQLLLAGDSPTVRRMSIELRRLGQYAEMAVAYARLESGPQYALRKYDLNAIIEKTVRKFDAEALEKRRPVTFTPAPSPVMVVTDGKWLAFTLERILSNALRHAYSGEITVSAQRDAGAADEMKDWARVSAGNAPGIGPFLTVRDNGAGIPPEKLERLLDRAPIRDGSEENRGLGLYLCRRICDDLGHSISIMSREGEGTCVTLELSLGFASPEETERKEPSPESASEESAETEKASPED